MTPRMVRGDLEIICARLLLGPRDRAEWEIVIAALDRARNECTEMRDADTAETQARLRGRRRAGGPK